MGHVIGDAVFLEQKFSNSLHVNSSGRSPVIVLHFSALRSDSHSFATPVKNDSQMRLRIMGDEIRFFVCTCGAVNTKA